MKNLVEHFNKRINRDEERICEVEDKKLFTRGQKTFSIKSQLVNILGL